MRSEQRKFVALHQSTLRKVDVIANIAGRAHERSLKTNTTWWEMHGGHARTLVRWIMEHKFWSFLGFVVTVVVAILSLLRGG